MRQLILIAMVCAGVLIGAHAPSATAAGFSNATISGPSVCLGSGFAMVTAGGKTVPVAASNVVRLVADGEGSFTSGSSVGNTGGTACSYTLVSGTYKINSDGTGTATVNFKGASSNPKTCPKEQGGPSSLVFQNAQTAYVVLTGKDFTGWSICNKQKP